ncbi:MAG: hypothetical protein U5J98_08725 [Halobacteriales archaeon]|nr:hypothetical protein [Halobacteriales archaeon]
MITVSLSEFMLELKEGVVKHVGPSNKTAEVKLYDVERVEAREFGDERVKLVFEDDAGSAVHVAVDPDDARALAGDIDRLAEESAVFE